MVDIVNAKRVWRLNEELWADKRFPLKQEIWFASTGVKTAGDPPWKYVEAFAGSGIETNPPLAQGLNCL
jgi:transaldolase